MCDAWDQGRGQSTAGNESTLGDGVSQKKSYVIKRGWQRLPGRGSRVGVGERKAGGGSWNT